MDRLSLLLVIIGAINWGLIGLFQFDLVAFLFGGQAALISRVLYTIIGAAGVKKSSKRSNSPLSYPFWLVYNRNT